MKTRASRASKKPVDDPPPALPERIKRAKRDPGREIALGTRIRTARLAAGMSLATLANAIGISYQQMQKYEKGFDRVAVSTLQIIASSLGIHPASFFDEDMPTPTGPIPDVKAVMKLGQRIQRVRDPVVAKRLLALADLLAGLEDEQSVVANDGTP